MKLKLWSQLFFITAMVLFIGGCATAYQPRGTTGGYSEIAPYEDGVLVIFVANAYTSRETVNSYAKYRAAELAHQQGWEHIKIENINEPSDAFKARVGSDRMVGRPVAILYAIPADEPIEETTQEVEKILEETWVITWSPLESFLTLVP